MHGALVVSGEDGSQVQLGAAAQGHRNGSDVGGQPLTRRSDQLGHQQGYVEHGGDRFPTAHPTGELLGHGDRGRPRRVAQQCDLSDDEARCHLDLDRVLVGAGVDDARPSRADEKEGVCVLALPHEHLPRGSGQRSQ